MKLLHAGQELTFLPLKRNSIQGVEIQIPNPSLLLHIMFRRFAGCPICNVGLRAYLSSASSLQSASVQPVVIFHSSQHECLRFQDQLPIPVIADETRELYRLFGVGTSVWSVANPRTWSIAIQEILRTGFHLPKQPQNPFVLPADFLIDTDGTLIECHYAQHAADTWSVAEVVSIVESRRNRER